MKNNWRNNMRVFAAFLLLTMLASCKGKEDHSAYGGDHYTCPMHPQIVQGKPGTCPICGMDLVRRRRPGEEVKITKELSNLLKPTNSSIVSSIKTVVPVKKEMALTTETKGFITYDTRRATSLPIRFGGRIEKLYVKYNFQPIHQGQKILEIYSPELVTAQRELLYLLESDPENSKLIEGSKQRLYLLGISEGQVAQLISSRKESYSFPIFSSGDGYVVQEVALNNTGSKPAKASQSTGMNNGMAASGNIAGPLNQSQIASTEIQVREGMYVTTGETLFKVINTFQVWADFDLYQKDATAIKINDPIEISFDNMGIETVKAKVNFIQPFFKANENFIKLRVYLANPNGKYEIGQLLTANFNTTSKNNLWIPTTSILDLGTQKIVFIRRRGVFRPRSVETGKQIKDWTELISGVEETDSIAYRAQFMVDSESFIRVSKTN